MEWVVLGAAFISGASALAGGWLSQFMQQRAEDRREARELRRRAWEARRDAYVDLLRLIDQLRSSAAGAAMLGGGPADDQVVREFLAAVANAEFHASPEAWKRMEPCLSAVQAQANWASAAARGRPEVADSATATIKELGSFEREGWDALRQEFIAAARSDLDAGAYQPRG